MLYMFLTASRYPLSNKMFRYSLALCFLINLVAALSRANSDLQFHRNWYLLDQKGNCGHSNNSGRSAEDSYNEISSRIFEGTDTIEHEFPWMVQLISQWERTTPFCGGTLISKRYILTAAHCVTDGGTTESSRDLFVRLGAYHVTNDCDISDCPNMQQVQVEEVIVHQAYATEPVPEYDDFINRNDIALIRFQKDVSFVNGVISPVCLPTTGELIRSKFYGQKMVAAGFGQNNTVPKGSFPEVIQKITTQVLKPKQCVMPIGWYGPQIQICTGGISNQGVCRGDSGGPLMYKQNNTYYQMGIASYIFKDCDSTVHPFDQDVIYTRVAHFLPWILDNIRE